MYFGFQRLAIMDISEKGDQPMEDKNHRAVLMCNGEIYNADRLTLLYNLPVTGHSDCEVILHMYLKFGIQRTLQELDGVFAFVIYDKVTGDIIAARDPYAVRPLFIVDDEECTMFASEIKSLYGKKKVRSFPGGMFWRSKMPRFTPYMNFSRKHGVQKPADGSGFLSTMHRYIDSPVEEIQDNIRRRLKNSIEKRMHSDRKIGCLLSGGLDSSLVASIVCTLCDPSDVTTYSIGMEGSTDLAAARKVAAYLGTDHHEITFTEKEAVNIIPNVIKALECWDTTTVRASTPMYLIARYIRRKTPRVKVIFSGEGADEVCQGYLYFHNQPSPKEGHIESVRILRDLRYFDVLRGDRTISTHGLELRVPFLDKYFVDYYMSIPPELRCPSEEKGEKWLLREAFDGQKLIPDDVLWRRKDGFSDGCSSLERPLYKVFEEVAEHEVSDEEFKDARIMYPHCPPLTKEAYWFRRIFHEKYPEDGRDELIPYQWMPRWMGNVTNPSGRIVPVFETGISR